MAIIDPQKLMEHLEDDLELLEQAYELFQEESESMQADLKQAVDRQDVGAIHSAAHSLKGMLSNFLAEAPCQTLVQIQESDQTNSDAKQQLLQNLRTQLDMMDSEIKQIIESGKA